MADRNFTCTIAELIAAGRRIHGALTDTKVGPPVVTRLQNAVPEGDHSANYPAYLDSVIQGVSAGGARQAGAAGNISTLTKQQALAYTEMERLMSAARRSAGLAFKGQDALLHAEFKVGVHEPQDLASELERAEIIHASAVKYATQLSKHGWIAQDAVELDDNIKLLGGKDEDQEAGKDQKKGITAARNRQANLLYTAILTSQNAARLAYPSTKIGLVEGVEEARARFLIDEFPPRRGGDVPSPIASTAVEKLLA